MHIRFVILLLGIVLFSCKEKNTKVAKADNTPVQKSEYLLGLEAQVRDYPDSGALHIQLATALDSAGFVKEALTHTAFVLKKDTLNYGIWYMHASLLENIGDTAAALNAYKKALHVYASPDAFLSLANLYAQSANALALNYSDKVLEMRMGKEVDANAYYVQGVYYARTQNLALAIELLDKCLRNNYTYMDAYIEKGLLYFDRKEYRKALDIFTFSSKINSLYADSYYYMARCYELMGIKDSAILRFQHSLSLDKNMVEAKEALKRLQ